MKNLRKALVVLMLVVLVVACVPSEEQVNDILSSAEQTLQAQITYAPVTFTPGVNAIVAQTFAAMTAQAALTPPADSVTATPVPGSVSGTLSYPSEFIPPLRVVAFRVDGQYYRYVETMENQSAYQITGLVPGTYHVVAYVMDGSYAGGYTAMVPCGLSVDCADHTLLDVAVAAGQDTPNINPGDWYADAGAFPPMPGALGQVPLGTPTQDGPPGLTGNGGLGGKLQFPSSGIPSLKIVAFRVGNLDEYYSITTAQNQGAYEMSLPPGQYYVVAYTLDGTLAGGYTQAVLCGLTADCTDHSLIAVQVSSMVVLNNEVNLFDWYAPEGTFPEMP